MSWIALLPLLAAPQDTGEQYYRFPKDTTWKFEGKAKGEKATAVIRVLRHDKDRVHVEIAENRESWKAPKINEFVWYVEKGILRMDRVKAAKVEPFHALYMIGSKRGDTWAGPGMDDGNMDGAHLGLEAIDVPAGRFTDAAHIRMLHRPKKGSESVVCDFHLVPEVGIVRMEADRGGGDHEVFELKEFKKGG
ncbi:MAG: hypothetical protein HYY17_10600 [Planctomycetes bacterium]|nr:hypothetical protein [Planctomycetota bacterium]